MRTRENLIQVRVTKEERKIIENNAKKVNMQIAPYIRMVAQNPTIINFDYSAIREHTKQISNIVNYVNRLIFTIEVTNNYLPKEIDAIVECTQQILETEGKLRDDLRKQWTKENKQNRK